MALKSISIKKIKILHIAQVVGGVEICLRQIIKNVDDDIFENIIVCQNLKNKPKFTNKNNVEINTYQTHLVRNINPILDFISLISTIITIYKNKPDIIHTHSAKGGAIGRLAALFFSIPVLYTPHAFSYLSTKNAFKKRVFLFVERVLKTKKVQLLATSESEQLRAINEVGYNSKQTRVLENAISPIKTYSKNSPRVNHKHYICSLGRPSYQKNTKMLIDVFEALSRKHSTLHLYIVGAGEYSPELSKIESLIESKNLTNRITIIPWVSRVEAMTILKFSKLYVSTSIYEGMPYAVIESLYLKKATVLTNCDGNRDLIQNNISGYLVSSKDEMIKKISHLLTSPKTMELFQNNAYNEFLKKHQIEIYIKKLMETYYTALK